MFNKVIKNAIKIDFLSIYQDFVIKNRVINIIIDINSNSNDQMFNKVIKNAIKIDFLSIYQDFFIKNRVTHLIIALIKIKMIKWLIKSSKIR